MKRLLILLLTVLMIAACQAGGGGGGDDDDDGRRQREYPADGIRKCEDTNNYCQGCCSWHGGVACYSDDDFWAGDSISVCADGTPMSNDCSACRSCYGCAKVNERERERNREDGVCRRGWHFSNDLGQDDRDVFQDGLIITEVGDLTYRVSPTGYVVPNNYPYETYDADCTGFEPTEWGFRFTMLRGNEDLTNSRCYNIMGDEIPCNEFDPVNYPLPQIQVEIDGQLHDCEIRYDMFLIPINVDDCFGDCGRDYPNFDPFEEYFHKVTNIFVGGIPIDMSSRNY